MQHIHIHDRDPNLLPGSAIQQSPYLENLNGHRCYKPNISVYARCKGLVGNDSAGHPQTDLELHMITNSYRAKVLDPVINSTKRKVTFHGDSILATVTPSTRSWVQQSIASSPRLDAKLEVYNFAVEGTLWPTIYASLEKAGQLSPAPTGPLQVQASVVSTGWHSLSKWAAMLESIRKYANTHPQHIILPTLPIGIQPQFFQDIAARISGSPSATSGNWTFWGNLSHSDALAHHYYNTISTMNEAIRQMPKTHGNISVVDLAALLECNSMDECVATFWDIGHPRPEKYPEITVFMREELERILG